MLQLGFVLDKNRIEATLWNLHVPLVLDQGVQAADRLRNVHRALSIVVEPEIRDAWNKANQGLFRPDDLLNETQVVLERAFANADPLMRYNRRFLHLRAALHDLSHFGDRYHAQATDVDTSHASRQLLYVAELVGFDKDDSRGVLRLKDLHNHERMALVELIDKFISQAHDQLTLHTRLDFQSP